MRGGLVGGSRVFHCTWPGGRLHGSNSPPQVPEYAERAGNRHKGDEDHIVLMAGAIWAYDVEIPRASSDTVPAEAQATQVILKLDSTACKIFEPPAGEGLPADCRVTLGDQKIAATELPARVGEILGSRPPEKRVLFLAADDRLNYEGVLRILDLAKSGTEDLKVEFITAN